MKNYHDFLIDNLEEYPVIAALNNIKKLDTVIASKAKNVFVLIGNIFNLTSIINQLKDAHKMVYVHFDLIGGFSKDTTGLNFFIQNFHPDGVISTKPKLIKFAKEKGIFTIQRLFLLDSLNLESGIQSVKVANAVEILPGIMPRITQYVSTKINKPIITGGLIKDKVDIDNSINSGAIGISTSNEWLWIFNQTIQPDNLNCLKQSV
ncbi:MAG: glycerol-3-phosphate responsive antiterminator [Spirochaetes bacterium]|nr:glycerol-3-phosphate responsive antiterminator [Spirochaetota bacterium]